MIVKSVAFVNGKGGCGKTTSIFHVAGVLSQKGEHVLVIDLDKQRNTTDTLLMENQEERKYTIFDYMQGKVKIHDIVKKAYFRSRGNSNPQYYGVDILPSDIRLEEEKRLRNIKIHESLYDFIREQKYSWVLVDMPPSNKALNQICFSQIVDYIIVPFSSDIYSVQGYGDLMDAINKARESHEDLHILGIYLSRYMENCAVDKYIKEQLENFGDIFLDIQIPLKADIREAVMFGRPISFYKTKSRSKTAYENLVKVIEQKILER